MTETDLTRNILGALDAIPWVEAWRCQGDRRGRYQTGLHSRKHKSGASDIVAVVQTVDGVGRMVALEVKTPEDPMRLDKRLRGQVAFIRSVRAVGGYGAFVTSVPEALEAVARARNGDDEWRGEWEDWEMVP